VILSPGQIFGKYITVRLLGQGSFGTVYEVNDNLLDRRCALKFVQNSNPTQFVAHYEAQILHRCRHDRIVSVNSVDAFTIPNGPSYAIIDMEYCSGGSVERLIKTEFVTIRKSIKILVDLLFGLEHAVRQGILHRDVKPANVMCVDHRYKLADFGIAKLGLQGSKQGSPVYSAPEVFTKGETSISSDIFSAGMTLFQICNNYPDLGAIIKIMGPILAGKAISTMGFQPFVPKKIRAVCNKACASLPNARYQSVEEMRQALERLRVVEDWTRVNDAHWQADIGGRIHEMRGELGTPIRNQYLVAGRRKTSRCQQFANVDDLKNWQSGWVYAHALE
jgi:eukaryotic-like serine/threonine-protein kinase